MHTHTNTRTQEHESVDRLSLSLSLSPPDHQEPKEMDQNSRSSSMRSHQDETGTAQRSREQQQQRGAHKQKHLDYYSIPVFLLESIVLCALAYLAYYLHFEHEHEPYISGFYCDDTAYRQILHESKFTRQFSVKDNELLVLVALLAVPIVIIFFCELVNSLFGAVKFRQIRALCACCKLHSITRRSIRFTGAYSLGYLVVMISCELLATLTGRLRPYFAQQCFRVYQEHCVSRTGPSTLQPGALDASGILPASQPISAGSINATTGQPINSTPMAANLVMQDLPSSSIKQLLERQWVDLTGQNLRDLCLPQNSYELNQLAMSWPSYPAAIFTYACLFVACYLCFVGTARPFRIITSCLVVVLLLLATVFDVQLVKEHLHNWEDVAASSVLASVVVIFILMVYLNRFKDSHYYGNQKVATLATLKRMDSSFAGPYSLQDKTFSGTEMMSNNTGIFIPPQGDDANGDITGNDLAMRYFQIPRANYRGAPRPLSSINNHQMRL